MNVTYTTKPGEFAREYLVAAALDALADTAAAQAVAHDPRADDYDPLRHHLDSGRSNGVHDALAVVTGMLADYRKAGAA